MLERFGLRKTIPQCDKGTRGPIGRGSAYPRVEHQTFSFDRPDASGSVPRTSFTLPLPLTDFRVSEDGRTFGGGTSREALRRARRSFRLR